MRGVHATDVANFITLSSFLLTGHLGTNCENIIAVFLGGQVGDARNGTPKY